MATISGETGMVLGTGKERPLSIGLHTDGYPEARFEPASLHQIRDHVLSLKVWVEHWQADRLCNLVPTESSLILAKAHAESALTLLDRMNGSRTREPA